MLTYVHRRLPDKVSNIQIVKKFVNTNYNREDFFGNDERLPNAAESC